MIKIKIATEERPLDSVDEQWINLQINRRRAEGQSVCVMVTIQEGDLDLILSTPNCARSGGGTRPARPKEREVLDLWNQRGLNNADFTSGNLVAFLKQLKRSL